jgi:molecular chaperone HtpG
MTSRLKLGTKSLFYNVFNIMTEKPSKHEFQAETKQVLDIVVNSLYKDKEIFVRELISNASDALEKLRRLQITEKDIQDDNLEHEIKVSTDESGKTLTIQDFGLGMDKEELIENLGTIAHSGSKAFMEALKSDGENNDNLIGKFGVGFYSVLWLQIKFRLLPELGKKMGKDNAGKVTAVVRTRLKKQMTSKEERKLL